MPCSTVTQNGVSLHTTVKLPQRCWWGSTKNHLCRKPPSHGSSEETPTTWEILLFFFFFPKQVLFIMNFRY